MITTEQTPMTIEHIIFRINEPLLVEEIIQVFNSSGIVRPGNDVARITTMFKNSNLIISAWDNDKLIGISRAITDFAYCCYLSDLAVRKDYQNEGIGKKMIELMQNKLGDEVMILLLAAPNAMEYYPKIGFEVVQNGFIIKRKR